MTTQLIEARKGIITPVMETIARFERVSATLIRDEIASGRAVLPANPAHPMTRPAIAGRAFRTKVNANLGRSTERSAEGEELRKLDIALKAGADFVMVADRLGDPGNAGTIIRSAEAANSAGS